MFKLFYKPQKKYYYADIIIIIIHVSCIKIESLNNLQYYCKLNNFNNYIIIKSTPIQITWKNFLLIEIETTLVAR